MKQIPFLLLLLIVVFTGEVLACSCVVGQSVDKEFERAPNVVILKARSIEKTEKEPLPLSNYAGIKHTVLTVEKVYKGTLKVGQELVFSQGGGADCVWTFSENSIGEEYLFYLGDKPYDHRVKDGKIFGTGMPVNKEAWAASTCSRSGNVRGRSSDLYYLDNYAKLKGKSRLSGYIGKRIDSAVEEQPNSYEHLVGREVKITGNGKSITVKADKNGVYEVYDLAPGSYTVDPGLMQGYGSPTDNSRKVVIKPGAHTESNFTFSINSAIRGKFYDANGKPLKDVCMRLVPARGTSRNVFLFDCTEPDGSFEFDDIPQGSYVLHINEDNKVTATEPFRTFYYPKGAKREDAGEIEIAPGTMIDNMVIVAPETAEIITVSGTVRMSDGKTPNSDIAEFTRVEFVADGDPNVTEHDPSSYASIDSAGRFKIRMLKGQKGQLYATTMAYSGKYINCPKLERLIAKSEYPDSSNDILSPSVFIDANEHKTGVVLTFGFPNCKIAPID